jgi:hypothetical protein
LEGLSELAKQGILGILLVAAVGAVVYLYHHGVRFQKECQKLQDERINDWKEIAQTIKDNSMVMRDWISANETRTRAIEATARTQELMAASNQNLGGQVENLASTIRDETERYSQIIRDLTASSREMREAMVRLLERQK